MTYFAHSNELDRSRWQGLKDHLVNTGNLALNFGSDTEISQFAYIAALLHDIGKYSQVFQKKLDGAHLKVDHSTAGAQEVITLFKDNPKQQAIATILAYCIVGHHGGMPDYGSVIDLEMEGTLQARLKKKLEDYSEYTQEIDPSKFVFPDYIPIKPIQNHSLFSIAFFTRMVYSILVDADFLDTETFMNNGLKPRGGYLGVEELCKTLNQYLEKFNHPDSPINVKRTETLKTCLAKAAATPGLFTLTVPTGGGKTLTSLAFALNHASMHGLKRIIYVIPYTSIIEQNAAEFKKCLGDENVLEHHSNFEWGEKSNRIGTDLSDDKSYNAIEKLKLAAENWDIPLVVTTNVQFFESLFSNRPSRCRKLHNIAKSVIIFDEAQMLPREYLQPCLYAVFELVKNYGATAVFCTATQPAVERFLPEEAQLQELSSDPQSLYDFYRRVKVKNAGKLTDAELIEHLNEHQQVLCIVNTRKHAKGLFDGIVNEGRFHLSTLMCPAHRKETIAAIRDRLRLNQSCRVISTQIMEAGIDVDFPVGYRAISGLDSIIQAAGRVNRERKNQSGDLYVFEPDSSFVKRTPVYIQQGADVARSILRDFRDDPACMEAIHEYFKMLYDLQDERAFDAKGILGCFEKRIPGELNFDFKTAAEKFNLIQDHSVSVIIPYNENAISLLQEVGSHRFPYQYSRKLQVFTVNIYEREYQALESIGLIDVYSDTYAVLNNMSYYDMDTGLRIPESGGGEAIFFDG